MNLREQQRRSTPSIPSLNEKDLVVITRKLTDSIMMLFKRDEDKEKRIRKLEEGFGRGRFSVRNDLATGDYTVSLFNGIFIVESNLAVNSVINFPKSTGNKCILIISNTGAGDITATANGGDLIMGNPTQQVFPDEGIIFIDVAIGRWIVI